ncbi:hypothetical protein [Sphingomonas aerophila]|nr:hypothetical protein [Sphingomonas aerophila]
MSLALVLMACSSSSLSQTIQASKSEALVNTEVGQDVVVTGSRPVIIKGKVRRCTPQAGDPLDRVKVSGSADTRGWEAGVHRYMAIVPRGDKFAWVRDADQITGPAFWQRVGILMENYRFRGMAQDSLMCVGGTTTYPYAFAGFRREFDAVPYRGKRLRFTLWVATRAAGRIVTWLGSRSRSGLRDGGNTDYGNFRGDHLWTPILLETGPIDEKADRISYGFNLQGSGDLWVYRPTFEVVEDYVGDGTDRIVFGKGS